MLQILNTGFSTAEKNMEIDAELLKGLDPKGDPILHLYQWEGPSLTYGYFINLENHLDLENVKHAHLSCARRPTGGGIVFHIWDLAFSFLMPASHPAFSLNTLENYRFVNQSVLEVMQKKFNLDETIQLIPHQMESMGDDCQNFCMAKPTPYDVVYKGFKIAGAAQRRRKQGYLHQGTISLCFPQIDTLQKVLRSKKDVLQAMMNYTFAPLGKLWRPETLLAAREEIQILLADKLRSNL